MTNQPLRVFSTFTGIGGFELGIDKAAQLLNKKVVHVGYSEIDKFAISVFEKHYQGVENYGDITKIEAESLPDFDCLVGGFPCQAFSIAGRRKGFEDTRGTLFFDLARILQAKQPRLFVFESVKGLLNHNGGNTFRTIITTIDELGYDCQWQVLNSKNFGVPQNRERIIIVGHLRNTPRPQVFPITRADNQATSTDEIKVGTLRTHKDGNGFREMKSGIAPTIPARARNDGSGQPVILTGQRKYEDGKRSVEYSTSDEVPTIRATHYKSGDNQPKVYIPEATKKGYAEATIGDSINLSQPNSKTRRGRVGKGIANTIDTGMHQYTIQPGHINRGEFKKTEKVAHTIDANYHKGHDNHGARTVLLDGPLIRRLTPIECERLQAFPDNWTAEGVKLCMGELCEAGKVNACLGHFVSISDTQRYKMCGNAVTTNVIQAVFERIMADS